MLQDGCARIEIAWQGGGVTVITEPIAFAAVSASSDETVDLATSTIEERDGQATLVTSDRQTRVFFTSREPVATPVFPPGSAPTAAPRHPSYAPDGSIGFVADWTGPAIWRLPPGGAPERVGAVFEIDHAPRVLPDGRIASLWQGRPDHGDSPRDQKLMTPDGASYAMLVIGVDIDDVTCGGRSWSRRSTRAEDERREIPPSSE